MVNEDKGINLLEYMEKLTGIAKEEQLKIMQEIKDNRESLEQCEYHEFSEELKRHGETKFRCKNCGGIVNWSEKQFYEQGLQHRRKYEQTQQKSK